MATAQINDILTTVESALKTIAEFNGGKVFHVVSEDDLMSESRHVVYPAVAVIYEGMRPAGPHESGLAVRAGFSIVLLTQDKFPVPVDSKRPAVDILDRIRRLFRVNATSPATPGNKWKFEFEGPAASRSNKVLVWVQRWSIPLQLSQS